MQKNTQVKCRNGKIKLIDKLQNQKTFSVQEQDEAFLMES